MQPRGACGHFVRAWPQFFSWAAFCSNFITAPQPYCLKPQYTDSSWITASRARFGCRSKGRRRRKKKGDKIFYDSHMISSTKWKKTKTNKPFNESKKKIRIIIFEYRRRRRRRRRKKKKKKKKKKKEEEEEEEEEEERTFKRERPPAERASFIVGQAQLNACGAERMGAATGDHGVIHHILAHRTHKGLGRRGSVFNRRHSGEKETRKERRKREERKRKRKEKKRKKKERRKEKEGRKSTKRNKTRSRTDTRRDTSGTKSSIKDLLRLRVKKKYPDK